jgi:hypothetical protein
MKKIVNLLIVVSCIVALGSCKKDDVQVDLTLEKTAIELAVGGTDTVKIATGNGSYVLTNSSEATATTILSESTISIIGVKEGTATLTVKDQTGRTATLTITVSPSTPEFVWNDTKILLDQVNNWGLTVQSNSIAVTNIATKAQYLLSWTGDMTVGDKTGGKLQIVGSSDITLTSLKVVKAASTGYYLTFEGDSKSGLVYFTK